MSKETTGKATFFKLVGGKKGGEKEFRNTIEDHFENFQKGHYSKIPTLDIDKDKYYIQAMDRYTLDEKYKGKNLYCWLIDISRINEVDEKIELADNTKNINERRRPIDHNKNEGLVSDTRILFDPFRNIIVLLSKRGCINVYDLRRFISKLIDIKGIKLEIMLNKKGLQKIKTMDMVEQITYKVATPDNFSSFRKDSRSELADMKMASKFKAENMKITLGATNLSKTETLRKIKTLLSGETGFSLDVLNVEGLEDGKKETIDLIKNKLEFRGPIKYEEHVDDKVCFGFLVEAYNKHYSFIETNYKVTANVASNID